MMFSKNKHTVSGRAVMAIVIGCLYSGLLAAEYVPFPGKLPVTLVSVDAANEVVVSFETWPGFRRNTTIVLPGIVIPEDTPQADACERERAARALAFTRAFFDHAGTLYVHDMRMETSADSSALSDITTDQGSLTQALKSEGLARADSVPADRSWCD